MQQMMEEGKKKSAVYFVGAAASSTLIAEVCGLMDGNGPAWRPLNAADPPLPWKPNWRNK